MAGEMKLIDIPYEEVEIKLIPGKGLNIGAGKNEPLISKVYGGEVGIILDGRGRQPFQLSEDTEERIKNLSTWSIESKEFPEVEVK